MDKNGMTVGAALAWGIVFLALIAFTDIEGTAPIAAGFAWLLFVAVLLRYGQDAFGTIISFNKGETVAASSPPTPRVSNLI